MLYLISAYGLFRFRRWTAVILAIATLILIAAFVFLKIHIADGGLYETKTVNALIFRISLTVILMALARFSISKVLSSGGK